MNHILRSSLTTETYRVPCTFNCQILNKKRAIKLKKFIVEMKNMYARIFVMFSECEFLGYLNGSHRFSVSHKNFFLVLLRAIYDFHTIKSLRLRRWELMRTKRKAALVQKIKTTERYSSIHCGLHFAHCEV